MQMKSNASMVFIDVDNTLLSIDSFRLLLRHIYFHLDLRHLPQVAITGMLRKGRLIDLVTFKEIGLIYFRGWADKEIYKWGENYYTDTLRHYVYPEGRKLCDQHRAKGKRLVLSSGSPDVYLRALASDLGIDDLICTRLHYNDGKFTGRVDGEDCLGAAKLERVLNYADSMNADLSRSYCYSDHHSDIVILEKVGHPVAVNPTHQLAEHANRNGWPILRWNNPVPPK